MRRLIVVLVLLAVASPATAAQAGQAAESIQMLDNRYRPAVATVGQGQSVAFTNFGQVVHDARDDTGLDLFDTENVAPPETATIDPLPGAGRFAYVCTFHPEMTGRLDVPVVLSRATAAAGSLVTVRWATTRAPDGLRFDVQRRRPGTTRFEPWRTGASAAAARWRPSVRGTWTIRARVRSPEAGAASAWSPPATLRVA